MMFQDTLLYKSVKKAIQDRVNQIYAERLKTIENIEEYQSKLDLCIPEINLLTYNIKRKHIKKQIDDSIRCMARISSGLQCSRSRYTDTVFCKSHNAGLPYGRIDDPFSDKTKKKGKNKNTIDNEISTVDINTINTDNY